MTPMTKLMVSLMILQVMAFILGMIFAFNIEKRREKNNEKA